MHLRLWLAAWVLLAATSCVPPPEPVPYAAGTRPASALGLVRVTWDRGTRPDAFCMPDIGEDIDYHLRLGLKQRGYQVTRVSVPPLDNSFAPDPVAGWSPEQLFHQAPGIDRILRVRVVEYLDASLCDTDRNGGASRSLDITAEAEVFDRYRPEPVWHTRQRCSVLAGSPSETVRLCVTDLTHAIWQRLPRATD